MTSPRFTRFFGQLRMARTPPFPPVLEPEGGPPSIIILNADNGDISVGGSGQDGDIVLKGRNNQDRIHLNAIHGNILLGGNGADGGLMLFPNNGDNSTLAQATIHLDGQAGDIKLLNADLAEEFNVADLEQVEPGDVMVLDREGDLRMSGEAYDKKVAGVISGGGDYKPGIVMDKKSGQMSRVPLAVVGKVYCKVDAKYSQVEVGDLLTTSPTPGHAMKADDDSRAFGAVIGKALKPLESGSDLIPILVALQ